MASAGASNISIDHKITGPTLNISTACSSGTHAIGLAFQMIRSGMVAAAITGGHEAPLTFGFLRAWDSMRVVSPTQCRPFSADRDGMTLGEGAAMLTLETLDSAQARNATIYAEIVGFGFSADAGHITQPLAEGAASAMRQAIADANASPEDVGYINAHGTGTQANDTTEAAAIHQVFGPRAPQIPVSSTKSLHGHSIGASGATRSPRHRPRPQRKSPPRQRRRHRKSTPPSTSTSSSNPPARPPQSSPSPTPSPSVASTPSSPSAPSDKQPNHPNPPLRSFTVHLVLETLEAEP